MLAVAMTCCRARDGVRGLYTTFSKIFRDEPTLPALGIVECQRVFIDDSVDWILCLVTSKSENKGLEMTLWRVPSGFCFDWWLDDV